MIELNKELDSKWASFVFVLEGGCGNLRALSEKIASIKEAFSKEGIHENDIEVRLEGEVGYYDNCLCYIIFTGRRKATREEKQEVKDREAKQKEKDMADLKAQYERLKNLFEDKS